MSNLNVRHPEEDLLLRYLDGELSARKSRQIRTHLEACWQCRAELEALEATIGECVRYRKNVLAGCLPPAPAQWRALDYETVDAELAAESLTARLARLFSPRRNAPLRWALSGAAVLALAFVAINKLGETPNVEAAALLKKAVAVSEARPHVTKRLLITTPSRRITRVIYGGAPQPQADAEIANMFRDAHYGWDDPLSAKALSDWREQLSRKQDQVTPDKDSYSIKTTTDEGALLSATLKMRATDFEAVEGRFEFRNREWVEMTELVDQQTTPASTVAGTAGGTPRQPGMPPVSSSSVAEETAEPNAFAEELQVFAALHQVGADLGDPIEVSREGREVLVGGTGVSHQRQQQVHGLLDRLPHVVVRFSDPSLPASNPAPEPATRDAAGPEKPKYPARLEARLGGRPQFERFSGQVLDWTDSAMSRVYALRRLAQQFPAEAEAAMRPEERSTLRNLAREHVAALMQDLQKISNTVNPVLKGMGTSSPDPRPTGALASLAPDTGSSWQSGSDELYASGRRMEKLLAVVLGVAPGAGEERSQELLSALARFTNTTSHCLTILSQ